MNTTAFAVCMLLCLCGLSMGQNVTNTNFFLNEETGLDSNNCTTSATACKTLSGIVDKIDANTAGNVFYTVTASKGTYSGLQNIQVDLKGIEFIIQAEPTASVTDVVFVCNDLTLTAFRVTSSLHLTNINIEHCGKAIDFEPVINAGRTTFLSLVGVQVSYCASGVYAVGGDLEIQGSSFRTIGNATLPGHAVSAENVASFQLTGSVFSESAQWSVVLSSSHELIDDNGILFENCLFLNGGGISLSTDTHFVMRDLIFSGMSSEWAIYLIDGSYSLSNVTINGALGETVGIYYHTTASDASTNQLIMDTVTVKGLSGVGIYIETDGIESAQITGSVFEEISGVAIQVGKVDALTVSGCTFTTVSDSIVRIQQTETDVRLRLAGIMASYSGPVEAQLTANSNATLMDSVFENVSPSALLAHGGNWDIHTTNITTSIPDVDQHSRGFTLMAGKFEVSLCGFANLTDPLGMGGAIYTELSTFSAENCTFYYNHANSGGAISAFTYDSFMVSGCMFYQNSADDGGGAIELDTHTGTATVVNCVFEGNTANIGAAVDCCSKTDQCSVNFSESSSQPNTYTGNVNGNQDGDAVNCGANADESDGSSAWAWIFGIFCALVFLAIVAAGVAFGYFQYQKHRKSQYESF